MRNSHSVPQKTKNTIKYDQAISAYSQREVITYIHTKSCTQILITALFVTVKKSGYNSNTLMNEQNMTSPFNGILFDLEKKWSTDTCCYNMDESWKYYANWKKSLSKDDTVYSFIYTKYAKQGNLRDRRRLDIAFGWCKNNVRGKWGVTATLYRYFWGVIK